jgi:hypothetical protein
MTIPFTQQDFDSWFLKESRDPRGYHMSYVQNHLSAFLLFIKRKIGTDFKGIFIEFGTAGNDIYKSAAGTIINYSTHQSFCYIAKDLCTPGPSLSYSQTLTNQRYAAPNTTLDR